jgi:hypothetical protein
LSITNFLAVLANPNVAEALINTLIACGGGTLIAVVIGLAFSCLSPAGLAESSNRSCATNAPARRLTMDHPETPDRVDGVAISVVHWTRPWGLSVLGHFLKPS